MMVYFAEVPLELQLREVHRHIRNHVGKGCKYHQISVDWDTITGAYNRAPLFPIMLIDTTVLDYWCAHPTVWEVVHNLQYSRRVLAKVRRTLPEGNKGRPAVMFGALLVYIPAHQA